MPNPPIPDRLSRRERQVMDLLIRLGTATGRDIQRELPDPPTYSAVRSILRILGEKKLIVKERRDGRDWYATVVPADKARVKALRAVVKSFFANSAVEAATALLGGQRRLSREEAEKLQKLIAEARRK